MTRSNQVIVDEFLNSIVKLVAQGSSDKYVLMVLGKFINGNKKTFPFLDCVCIDLKGISVDKKINSVNPRLIGKFLKILINSVFSELFMLLVKRKIPKALAKDLEALGVIID